MGIISLLALGVLLWFGRFKFGHAAHDVIKAHVAIQVVCLLCWLSFHFTRQQFSTFMVASKAKNPKPKSVFTNLLI
jgi:hypothetical protein